MPTLTALSLLFLSASATAQMPAPAPQPVTPTSAAEISPASIVDLYKPPVPLDVKSPRASGPHVCACPTWLHVGDRGMAVVAFTITAQGMVADANVVRSSGSPALDDAAEVCVVGWLYSPATKNGQPVPFRTAVGVGWIAKLKDEPPVRGTSLVEFVIRGHGEGALEEQNQSASGTSLAAKLFTGPVLRFGSYSCEHWHHRANGLLLGYYVEPDGSLKDITVLNSNGDAEEDKDAVECVGKRLYRPAMQDGHPIEVHLAAKLYS